MQYGFAHPAFLAKLTGQGEKKLLGESQTLALGRCWLYVTLGQDQVSLSRICGSTAQSGIICLTLVLYLAKILEPIS